MPLDPEQKRVSGLFHRFDDAVRSTAADRQAGGDIADGLMMKAVDFQREGFRYLRQPGPGFDRYPVGRMRCGCRWAIGMRPESCEKMSW